MVGCPLDPLCLILFLSALNFSCSPTARHHNSPQGRRTCHKLFTNPWICKEKQQIVKEQQQPSKSKIYPPRIIHENSCAFGLLLWKSPKGFLNIWSPSLRQASNSSFERSSEYYCACPRGYDQHGCAKSNQELKIPRFRMARCTYGWHNVVFDKLTNETNVKHRNKMEKLFSRYLHNRYHGGVLVPLLEINQTIPKDELTTENPVDQYFLDLALNNTGWNDLDLSTIHLLLTYNQKLFYDSTEPLLTGDMTRSDWFNGKSIILGKVLYTFMFSKCGALDVIEYMLNVMYSKDHYFVLFLSENMNNCRKQVEDMVEKLRLDNSEATNIWMVPQHLSFKSYRAHITLVHEHYSCPLQFSQRNDRLESRSQFIRGAFPIDVYQSILSIFTESVINIPNICIC